MPAERGRPQYQRLDSLADVVGGVALGGSVSSGLSVELPYLRVANVQDGYISTDDVKTVRVPAHSIERFRLQQGDVLLTEGGDFDKLGRGAVWDGRIDPCLHQNHVFRVRCFESRLLPDFLALYLASPTGRSYFLRIAKQTTNLATISSSQLKAMPVPYLPLPEQQRIVEIFAAADAMERGLKKSIAKSRDIRRGMALEELSPITATAPVGGWMRLPLREVVPFVEYGISEALNNDPRGIPVLRMNNLRDGKPDLADLRYCPVPVPGRIELRRGDVLFNRTNSIDHVGKAGIWGSELSRATFASYLVRLKPDTERLLPEYLVEWLMHPVVRQRVRSISTVAVQQVNVNPTRLQELEIDFPVDLAEQRRIVATLSACDEAVAREGWELAKLRTLQQGISVNLLPS
ncbi:restriction endonuclease subunit S [Streptomyces cellostaticus]|uniref:restriction endonuclease subunit S n=1 Tax=Streptomyces cellostaticus TaxID=67285 RepID=UPI00099E47BF|nr:restriction endonuclease subunit S [Streptomyces cellostaticus]GHI07521.1 hypothetical protein Scel_58420 [Streptomyces cellostaticus]